MIDSSSRPSPPLNGDVALSMLDNPGHFEQVDLDYVGWFRDALGRLNLKCHDPGGNVLVIAIRETIFEDIMFPGNQIHHPSTPPDWR